MVAYEANIVGHILSKDARLPSEGATIKWTLVSTTLTGSVISKRDGSFELHIVNPNAVETVEAVKLEYSHNHGGVDMLFVCDGVTCGPGQDALGVDRGAAEEILFVEHFNL